MAWHYDPIDYYKGKVKMPEDRPDVARRLASTITAQRRGHARPDYGRTHGRVDARNLSRAATGNPAVFKRPGAASPTRIRLVVILDLSGSMHGPKASRAAQMGWDLISAAKLVQSTVTVEVYGHTTGAFPFGVNNDVTPEAKHGCYNGEAFISLVELWKPGMTRWHFHQAISKTDFRGNEDGWPLKVAYDDVKRRVAKNERVVIVMVSDGAPYYKEGAARAFDHVRSVANDIRRKGDVVVSVSVERSYRRNVQDSMYGHDNVIVYDADVNVLTRNIATVVGRALN